ncbi:hypothetical protein BST61_g1464 [Cercospora zeina]
MNFVINIAPGGDLIVAVANCKFRVQSQLLKMHSPVFRVMLGPRSLEAQSFVTISSISPGRLELPDDDVVPMLYLFHILHDFSHGLLDPPDHALLFATAKVADKYDCVPKTRLSFDWWLSQLANLKPYQIQYGHLATAYILDDAYLFELWSRKVLMRSNPHDFRVFCQSATDGDKFGIVAAFKLRYDLLRSIVVGSVDCLVENMCKLLGPETKHYADDKRRVDERAKKSVHFRHEAPPGFCDYYQRMVTSHLTHLAEARIWPDCRAETLDFLLSKLRAFELPSIQPDDGQCKEEAFWENNWFANELRVGFDALIFCVDRLETKLCFRCVGAADGSACKEHQGLRITPSVKVPSIVMTHLEKVREEFGDL